MFACHDSLLGFAGFLVGKLIADASSGSSGVYAKAGGIAQECLSNIRTVAAFNGQERSIAKYDKYLLEAQVINEKKSWKCVCFGMLFGIYALAFWYNLYIFLI